MARRNGGALVEPLAELALRFEKAFGVKMDTLLRMQGRYGAYQMRQREADIPVKHFVYG